MTDKFEIINFDDNMTTERIDSLVDCLNITRFNDRCNWLRFIRSLKNIGELYPNIDVKLLGHKYSKLSDKYNEAEVEAFFNNTTESEFNNKLLVGSMCYWAKLDNPNKYNALFNELTNVRQSKLLTRIDTAEKAPIKYSFPDYTQFVGKNLTDEYEENMFYEEFIYYYM